jgi:hypothetical protein
MSHFQERQYLRSNPITWVAVLAMVIPIVIILSTSAGEPAQDIFYSVLFVTLFEGFFLTMLLIAHLDTDMDMNRIRFRWFPFQLKHRKINWSDVQAAEVRKYNPLMEYGGWGLKGWTSKNRAYNVDGSIGIQLFLKNGHKVLIGTKQRESAEALLYDLRIPKPAHG